MAPPAQRQRLPKLAGGRAGRCRRPDEQSARRRRRQQQLARLGSDDGRAGYSGIWQALINTQLESILGPIARARPPQAHLTRHVCECVRPVFSSTMPAPTSSRVVLLEFKPALSNSFERPLDGDELALLPHRSRRLELGAREHRHLLNLSLNDRSPAGDCSLGSEMARRWHSFISFVGPRSRQTV